LIPNTLRNHLEGQMPDGPSVGEFISLRNAVFHGSRDAIQGNVLRRIESINPQLLLALRNILGAKFNLPPMQREDLPPSGHDIQMTMSVFYTTPETTDNQTGGKLPPAP